MWRGRGGTCNIGQTSNASNRKAAKKMLIKRLYRQHNTTVLSIPRPVLEALDLAAGDYVELEVVERDRQIRMAKIEGRIENDRRNEIGKSEHDNGGQT